MIRYHFLPAILLFLFTLWSLPATACGAETDCSVGDRIYRIALPESGAAPVGAVIWAHGYRGTAAGVMGNGSLRKMILDAGLALIAVQGVDGTWDLPNGPRTADSTGAAEFAYFDEVILDATKRFALDPKRIVASGFSAGAMMVWNLACSHPERFAGFIPVSGTFWLRPPQTCALPVSSIVHFHGNRDTTVPLTGREIGATKQGDVAEALAFYGRFGDFGPATRKQRGDLTCDSRANAQGNILEFCLFKGGHSFRTEHLRLGLEALRAAGHI